MHLKTPFVVLSGMALLSLTACNTAPTSQAPAATPSATTAEPAASPDTADTPAGNDQVSNALHGGQVVEMGDYHLELLAAPEEGGVHIDFWLLDGDDHQGISDASVAANIQFPDGTSKTIDLTYDEKGKHYKAFVPDFTPGAYRVVIQTDVKGEKMNGRFNFDLQ